MFLRPNRRSKDGKEHTYWSLVETVRTADGPRQKTLCYLGELNGSAQARGLKTVEVFNEQGEREQWRLFPSQVEPPADDPQVARVLVNKVRLERMRQFGACWLGWELWRRLELDRFFEERLDVTTHSLSHRFPEGYLSVIFSDSSQIPDRSKALSFASGIGYTLV